MGSGTILKDTEGTFSQLDRIPIMARQPRTDFEGATHHVYGRGNNRQRIFHDEADYLTYLSRLAAFKRETGIRILACCPMPNHYHLVPQTGPAPLEEFMQRLNSSYTRLYNDRWVCVGHVFQGRYGARRCKTEAEVKAAIRYVHMNPVQDGLVAQPEDWPWSSHRGILAGHDPIVDVAAVLELFGGADEYLRFLRMPLAKDSRTPLTEILATFPEPDAKLILGSSRSPAAAHLRRDFVIGALNAGYRRSAIAKFVGRTPSAISQWLDSSKLKNGA